MNGKLVQLLSDLNEPEALAFVDRELGSGTDPARLLDDAREGLAVVGERFAAGDYFIPDLIFSAEIMKGIISKLEPHLKRKSTGRISPQVVVGTVAGDIHDIGKNLVTFMLEVSGFGVIDLGVDVAPEGFVSALRDTGSTVVALSGFLTVAFKSMKATVEAIRQAGLREQVKIIVGGGQVDEQVRRYTGADAFGNDAMDAVRFARLWLGE